MNILVTAGNSMVPIDKVRCLTNIFTGRTGAGIALEGHRRGHQMTLLTSHSEAVAGLSGDSSPAERWRLLPYQTFDELQGLMAQEIGRGSPQALIHVAAVSDYRAGGIYAPAGQTRFHDAGLRWEGDPPEFIDMAAGKVKSDAPELWLRLIRTPKLVDLVRSAWGFRGILVKFKLEVGVSDQRLLEIAERSRCQSAADLLVANTLDAGSWAYLGPVNGTYQRVARSDLASRLLDEVERLHHG